MSADRGPGGAGDKPAAERARLRLDVARRTRASLRDEVDAELRFHIEERVEELVARGVPRAGAEAEVRAKFGDVAGVRAECEAIDVATHRRRARHDWLGSALREARLALRALARRPAFSVIAVLTLALGIGATTAIYTLLDRVALRPLPYPAADRLVYVRHPAPGVSADAEWSVSVAGYYHFRNHARTLDGLASHVRGTANFAGDDGADRVATAAVDPKIFPLLGLRAALGRVFVPEEVRPDSMAPVAILGHAFWRQRFGGDSGVVGRTVSVDSRRLEVVGVLAEGADLPGPVTDVWLPAVMDSTRQPINEHYLDVVSRLRPGVTPADAERELRAELARFSELYPTAYSEQFLRNTEFSVRVVPVREQILGDVGRRLWMLFGAVGFVFAVACANVANLFLVRRESGRREAALRTALGAARSHLAWHYLVESLLLALAAAALGLGLAWAGLKALLAVAPSTIPRLAEVRVGWSSAAVAVGVALLAGVLFGLAPLLRHRVDVEALREGGRGLTASAARQFVRRGLVIAQVALALVLLAGAGLMLQSVRNLRRVEAGFAPRGVLTFAVALPSARYKRPAVAPFYEDFLGRVAALPGVTGVGATTGLPLASGRGCSAIGREDRDAPGDRGACVGTQYVAPGYFRAMGINVRGRAVTWADEHRKSGEVVVTRAFAERFWPGQDPIGKGLLGGMRTQGPPWYRVVGVTDDIRHEGLDRPPLEGVFFPMVPLDSAPLWGPPRYMTVVVRTGDADPERLTPAVRRILRELDPEVPLANPQSMETVVAKSMARTSFTTLLLTVAAAMALVLSAVGLYGVVAYLVAQRRAEIGVRMALGARVGEVGRLVVLQSVRLAAAGVAVGVVGAAVATRALRSMLYDVSPGDPAVLALVSAVLVLVAAAASWGPARRAARVDPVEALRGE